MWIAKGEGVALRILNFGGGQVDTRGAAGRLILNVFAAFAQFELEIMKERQREGIANAKSVGRYRGRKPTARAKAADAIKLFKEGKRVSEVAKMLKIGRASVYRALEDARRQTIVIRHRAPRLICFWCGL